jgi:SAM-dependent methyltransferase
MNGLPRLYTDLADWWPVLSSPDDYAEEAAFYRQTILDAASGPAHTLLELGCGGGSNAYHLKHHFQLTLTDLSPGMLAVSQQLNPECEHLPGDMRTLRLGRQFDIVFIHDAIEYMTTEADLRAALTTAYAHCRPGGVALFAPDQTTESFRPGSDHGGHDRPDRALRYLEWTWDDDPTDTQYRYVMVYLLREADGRLQTVTDEHHCGLFPHNRWLQLLAEVGFEPRYLPFQHSEVAEGPLPLFVGRKPAA